MINFHFDDSGVVFIYFVKAFCAIYGFFGIMIYGGVRICALQKQVKITNEDKFLLVVAIFLFLLAAAPIFVAVSPP